MNCGVESAWSLEDGTHATIHPSNWLFPSDFRDLFAEQQPLTLDLGAGKGRFLLARAAANPTRNYLGLERQLKRVRKMDRKIKSAGLSNTLLFRMEAGYALRHLFPAASVDRCFIFFPDPWPKSRHSHHRILGPEFLDDLARVMCQGGHVHFATDHLPYFHQVVPHVLADSRFQEIPCFVPAPAERTDFELRFHERKPIGRISFCNTGRVNSAGEHE